MTSTAAVGKILMVIGALALAVTVLFICAGCQRYSIKYEVTGSAPSVTVEYLDARQSDVISTSKSLPWVYQFRSDGKTRLLHVTAKWTTGTADVNIYADDVLVEEGTAVDDWTATASTYWP